MDCKLDNKIIIGRKQKKFDLAVVALTVTTEFISIDGENYLFKLINRERISYLFRDIDGL